MRRDQDVLNPGNSHCNFMALAHPDSSEAADRHPFVYGRILSIFHVNVVYNGPGMIDYNPRRFNVLWVRWYDLDNPPLGKSKAIKAKVSSRLDRLVLPPLAEEPAIGFLDPGAVLRGCHIIPAFAEGKRSSDSEELLSKCAREDTDWVAYYVSR